jgi:hypothetical protein
MSHARAPASDLEVSVRARRLACVLDPALLLAAPHGLLLAQRLARTVDLWVCPAFWRLLDASEFFGRRPARLRTWLALGDDHPVDCVAAAVAAWSRWRVSRDLSALGLYWVGGHQTESFLPEHGPRDLPARFEALADGWRRAAEARRDEEGLPDPQVPAAATLKRLPGGRVYMLESAVADLALDDEGAAAPAQEHEGALESGALAVALQAPVLTIAAGEGPPALVRHWAENGLAGAAWPVLHPPSAAAEQERWWNAAIASGAAATIAAASMVGVRLALAHVVAPSGEFVAQPECDGGWGDEFAWSDEPDRAPLLAADARLAVPWWRDAQALWMSL